MNINVDRFRNATILASEPDLINTLRCDELCVLDNKRNMNSKMKEIVEMRIMEKGCSCSTGDQFFHDLERFTEGEEIQL
ncbi:MAG: hypothetical protein ACLFPQ_00775 [Candidatus Woesearchaeota archaeon]